MIWAMQQEKASDIEVQERKTPDTRSKTHPPPFRLLPGPLSKITLPLPLSQKEQETSYVGGGLDPGQHILIAPRAKVLLRHVRVAAGGAGGGHGLGDGVAREVGGGAGLAAAAHGEEDAGGEGGDGYYAHRGADASFCADGEACAGGVFLLVVVVVLVFVFRLLGVAGGLGVLVLVVVLIGRVLRVVGSGCGGLGFFSLAFGLRVHGG